MSDDRIEHFNTTQFRQGCVACLPTILGYWSIGFAAGAIGSLSGFSILDIGLLSAFLYAGSAQFLFYSLHAAGAGVTAIVLGIFLINIRYLLICSYMAHYFTRVGAFEKFVGGALLTDETFGLAAQYGSRHGSLPFSWLLGLNLTAWLNWIFANLVGAVFASSLPPKISAGLGFSLVSMFIALLLMTWLASRRRALETVAIAVAMLVVWISNGHADGNLSIIVATLSGATLAAVLRWTKREEVPS